MPHPKGNVHWCTVSVPVPGLERCFVALGRPFPPTTPVRKQRLPCKRPSVRTAHRESKVLPNTVETAVVRSLPSTAALKMIPHYTNPK